MTDYAAAGVNIEEGDKASKKAYDHAMATFASRDGLFGTAVVNEGGFSGFIDMKDFYLVQNDDGVGTKVIVAHKMGKYDTLGYDLLAMVADDAICVGAETVSITNTIDIDQVDQKVINEMMAGLSQACQEQKIMIAGGEIAELNTLMNGFTWNASAIGVVDKNKVITGKEITPGDVVLGLKSDGFRANGMSLVRKILTESFGENWYAEKFDEKHTWGEKVLTPAKIYSAGVLELIGRRGHARKVNVKGLAHITGGGITNLSRALKVTGLGASLTNLWQPHESMKRLIKLGNVDAAEAYRVWNMGTGMMLVVAEEGREKSIALLAEKGLEAQKIGVIENNNGKINYIDWQGTEREA